MTTDIRSNEPTDDREALKRLIDRVDDGYWRNIFPGERDEIADAILAAGFSRATVPDATTEEAFKKAEAFDKAVALSERRQTLLEEAEAERDAALAAIERVRAMHLEVGRQVDDAGVEYTVCKHCTEVNRYGQVRWPCPTRKALDEAPKPEEKP